MSEHVARTEETRVHARREWLIAEDTKVYNSAVLPIEPGAPPEYAGRFIHVREVSHKDASMKSGMRTVIETLRRLEDSPASLSPEEMRWMSSTLRVIESEMWPEGKQGQET